MKVISSKVVRDLAFCSAAALLSLIACSDDPDDSAPTGGTSGKAGSAGSSSTAGKPSGGMNSGGSAGNNSSGNGGNNSSGNGGASAGTGGKATAGSAGTSGSSVGGNAGTSGNAGAAGEGGSGGDGGSAGAGGDGGSEAGSGGDWSASGAGGAGGAGEPVVTATNLSIGKTATASSEESGNGAPRGIDDDTATRWCAANGDDGQWYRVDLGAAHDLTGVEVFWESNAAAYKYQVEVSNDDLTWSVVVDKSTNTTVAQTTNDTVSVNARYVRLTTLNIEPDWMWASFWELRVMGH